MTQHRLMHDSRRISLALLSILGLSSIATVLAQSGAPLDLVTPGFSLRFQPKRAWTYGQIDYKGETISGPTGFHGLVLATGPAKFIGSGHNEGGLEVVESIDVVVDGQPRIDLEGRIECREAIVTKRSRLGDFTHEAIVKLSAERIDLDYQIKATKNSYLEILYPFMFCWSPTTTEWMAAQKGGEILSGEFQSNNGWQLEKDVAWASVYMPDKKIAAVVKFSEDLPPGALHKHGFWDRETYHKQYYQSFWKASITEGESFRYQASVMAAEAAPDQWKEVVQNLLTSKTN